MTKHNVFGYNLGKSVETKTKNRKEGHFMKRKKFSAKGFRSFLRIFGFMLVVGVAAILVAVSTVENNLRDTSAADVPNTGKMVEVRVLNTQTNSALSNTYSGNESIIIKTYDNKYVLIDAGNNNADIESIIYNALVELQGTADVVIDYMFVSHLDGDHVGGAYRVIGDDKILVKNLIIKNESWMYFVDKWGGVDLPVNWGVKTGQKWYYIAAIAMALRDGARVFTTSDVLNDSEVDAFFGNSGNNDYMGGFTAETFRTQLQNDMVQLSEGMSIAVGDYLVMNVYNTSEVYSNTNCSEENTGDAIGWWGYASPGSDIYTTGDGEYVYFDSNDYPNIELKTTSEFKQETGVSTNKFRYRYYYAYLSSGRNVCRSNANSMAFLGTVMTSSGNKYMYFPNDIENVGYDIIPTNGVFGNGFTTIYHDPTFGNGHFVGLASDDKLAPETEASRSIKTKLGTNVKDIVIYQMSHHSYNVAPDAVDLLSLNRSENAPFAISTSTYNMATTRSFDVARSYYYSLGNLPERNKMNSSNDNDGVYCSITAGGNYYCRYYAEADPVFQNATLSYDANSGAGAPAANRCEKLQGACSVTISSVVPTRSGYTFLGWADSASATSASYQPGGSITLSGNKTIYAVWEKIIYDQTVSFATTSISKTYGDSSFTNLATTTGNGTITYASNNTNVAIVNANTGAVTIKGVGTATITATAAATADYHEGSNSYTLIVAKANQTVSFPVSTITKAYNDSSFTNIATNNRTDGGTIRYTSSNTNIATVNPNSGAVTIISAGTVTITATAEATANYNTGTSSYTLVINPITPTAYFENTEIAKTYGDDNFSNEVTTVSDGTVTYSSSNPAVATVIPNTGEVTIVGAGDTTITASIVATTNYEAATANYTITVAKKTSVIPEEAREPRKGWISDTLSTITLGVDGLVWDNPETIIEEGSHFYRARYTTNNDTTNYTTEYLDITVLGEHRTYTVVEGDGQTYQLNEKTSDMVFKIDADYSLFERGGSVYIDEEQLNKQYYDSESGSTIINIHHDYLKTLETGEHTLAVSFNDGGTATARFIIAEKEKENEPVVVPDTGSNNGVAETAIKSTGISVVMVTIIVVSYVCIYKNKQKRAHKKFD